MTKRTVLWLVAAFLYLIFAYWYTNTEGPLTGQEIETLLDDLSAAGYEDRQLERLRGFMEGDTGRQFIMLNNIDLNETPPRVEGAEPDAGAEDLMSLYMEYMWPALFRRACHPVYAGGSVYRAMDMVGIENAEVWDQGALMRYRSRRDMLEIVSNPVFRGRHDFKMAALDKTIAYPMENVLYLSDPRFLLALILFSLASLLDLLLYRRG